jgi:hypothetical protein
MNLICQKCDETWEVCYVGCGDMDADGNAGDAERFKAGEGCPACKWGAKAPKKQSFRGEAMGMLADLLGDDIDGMASMLDEAEYAGMFDDMD